MKYNFTVAKAILHGICILRNTEDPRLEAELLLAHSLNVSRAWIAAHPDTTLTEPAIMVYNNCLQLRTDGEPLPYLVGYWEFYGIDFAVDKRALIPRPETEMIVEHTLSIVGNHSHARIVDVGTGCGTIAIPLAMNLPNAFLFATDISKDALSLARSNSIRHGVLDRIEFVQADLLTCMSRFDVICANLPYLTTLETGTLLVGEHEPHIALDGGANGLNIIRQMISTASKHLNDGGSLLMEFGNSSNTILEMARYYFGHADCKLLSDLSGRPRMLQVIT